jgi:hypothetical protein
MIPPSPSNFPFCFTSRGRSHNVNRFGGRGIKIPLTGAFSIRPQSALESASAMAISDTSLHITAYSTVNFHGVIPGGDSFNIPQSSLSTNTDNTTGFSWTVDIASGTDIIVVGGDDRGIGSGGNSPFTVAPSSNISCLSSTSPSSTPGSPAGSTPTSTGSTSGSSRDLS